MKCLNILLLIILGFVIQTNASNVATAEQIDSLTTLLETSSGKARVDILCELVRNLGSRDMPKALEYAESAIQLSSEINYQYGEALASLMNASLLLRMGQLYEAEEISLSAVNLADEIDNAEVLSKGYLTLSVIYITLSDYPKGYKAATAGMREAKRAEDVYTEIGCAINLGVIKEKLEEYDEAERYYLNALAIAQKERFEEREGGIYANLGLLAFSRNNWGNAIENGKRAIEIFRKQDNKYRLASSLFNVGTAYEELAQYDLAMLHFEESLDLREQLRDSLGENWVRFHIGSVLLQQGEIKEGQNLINAVLEKAQEAKQWKLLEKIYSNQYEFQQSKQNWKAALRAFQSLNTIQDTLADKLNRKRMDELAAEYKHDELLKTAQIQEQEVELSKLRIKQQWFILGLLGLALFVSGILFTFFRQRMRLKLFQTQQQFQESKQAQDKLASELEEDRQKLLDLVQNVIKQKDAEIANGTVSGSNNHAELNQLIEKLSSGLVTDEDWVAFNLLFDVAYPSFGSNFKNSYPACTRNDYRLASLMRIRLSNKQIGLILNISSDSVVRAKHRMRQKMGFENNRELTDALLKM